MSITHPQSSLFQIFNTLVRASPESREGVLEYFATAVKLNIKRAGMQVHGTLSFFLRRLHMRFLGGFTNGCKRQLHGQLAKCTS